MNALLRPTLFHHRRTTIRFALASGLALGVAFGALAQAVPPPPSPFQSPVGPPPVTSTTANGRLGAAPVAPRADELTPPTPIDEKAARAAATRNEAPLPKSVEQGSDEGNATRRARGSNDSSPAISPAGAGNAPAGTPIR